jgi:hypothetical protein
MTSVFIRQIKRSIYWLAAHGSILGGIAEGLIQKGGLAHV